MAKWNVEKKTMEVGGHVISVRAMTARERQALASRSKSGDEMSNEAVLLCAEYPDGTRFFADLSEVLDAPCGFIAQLGEAILELSGFDKGGGENPT